MNQGIYLPSIRNRHFKPLIILMYFYVFYNVDSLVIFAGQFLIFIYYTVNCSMYIIKVYKGSCKYLRIV
jgi:hypothetical protein